jgi:hypothetical protein
MVTDILNSFKDNVSQKATNPFLATILIVWTFKNWRLLYALLYFDEKTTLETRLAFIEGYYSKEHFFYINLLESIAYAFIVLISTYLLLGVARFIVDLYTKIVLPWISKWTDKNSIVSREDYRNLYNQCDELERKLEDEKAAKIRFKRELEAIEAKNSELLADNKQFMTREENYKETEENIKILSIQNSELVSKEEHYKTELNRLKNLEKENTDLKGSLKNMMIERETLVNSASVKLINGKVVPVYKEDQEKLNFIKKIEREDLSSRYVELGKKILNSEPLLKSDQLVRYLVSQELIEFKKEFVQGISAFYEFSEMGKEVFRYLAKHASNLDQQVVQN